MPNGTIPAETKPSRNADVRFRRIDNRLVLIVGAQVYELNETAETAWSLCSGENTFEDIVGGVVSEYDVDATQVRADLEELFAELEEVGAVTLT